MKSANVTVTMTEQTQSGSEGETEKRVVPILALIQASKSLEKRSHEKTKHGNPGTSSEHCVHAGLQEKLISRPRPEQERARRRAVSVYLSIVYLDKTKH